MYKGKVSSTSLWHFTKSIDIILSIIKNGFYPRVAKEDMNFLMKEREHAYVGTPMVCFTDIPIDHFEDHIKQYGQYAIGMSKAWGIKNGLNPILYIVDDSDLNNAILKLQWDIVQNNRNNEKQMEDIAKLFWGMAGYFKRYMESETVKPYYDEREWRYLVPFSEGEYTYRLIGDDFMPKRIDSLNFEVQNKFPLKFDIKDIDNIIFPEDENENELKSKIYNNSNFTEEQKKNISDKLTTIKKLL